MSPLCFRGNSLPEKNNAIYRNGVLHTGMINKEQLIEWTQAQLAGSAFFVVDVLLAGLKTKPKLTVWLDGDAGVSIDTCAKISRKLGNWIDENELIPDAYTLEVSSPGIDQPLKLLRQYPQHIGRKLKITTRNGNNLTGKLASVTSGGFVLNEETDKKNKKKEATPMPVEITFADVEKAVVLVSFN